MINKVSMLDELFNSEIKISVKKATDLRNADFGGHSDPLVKLTFNKGSITENNKTKEINNTENPEWNETLIFKLSLTKNDFSLLKVNLAVWD